MTPSKGTPIRPVRVDDELWTAAKAKSEATGVPVSDVIRDALRAWVAGD